MVEQTGGLRSLCHWEGHRFCSSRMP